MKKIYLSVALLLAAAVSFSQQNKNITWGIHAGMNVATVSGDYSQNSNPAVIPNYKSKIGFNGGIDVQVPVLPHLTIQPELSFSQMGAKGGANNPVPGAYIEQNQTLTENYLSLPILIKYHAPKLKGFAVYIGPQYSYLLNAKGSDPANSQSNVSESYTSEFHRSEISGIVGLEYYCRCGFGISARYQLGFSNFYKGIDDDGSVKNHGFTFTVGYRF